MIVEVGNWDSRHDSIALAWGVTAGNDVGARGTANLRERLQRFLPLASIAPCDL